MELDHILFPMFGPSARNNRLRAVTIIYEQYGFLS
jgi:hypothetical protein